MRTVINFINTNHPAAGYFGQNTSGSRAVRNTANFLIRNTYTGLRKFPEERTHNETEVLHKVFTGIQMANETSKQRFQKFVRQVRLFFSLGYHGMDLYTLIKDACGCKILPYPTMEKWMLSYEQIDAIMKNHNEPCYRKCVSHVAQQAIRKTVKSWKSYFNKLAGWKENPSQYNGKPGIPGYIRKPETTAHFTNEVAKPLIIGDTFALRLTKYDNKILDICPSKLIKGKFVKLEVMPWHGGYRLLITYDDKLKEPEVPKNPTRIGGIDLGMTNFAAVATNTGLTPFVIDGLWLKSLNQDFNKEHSRLISALTSGSDSKHSVKNSKRLDSISRHRDDKIRDFFYKTGHYIFRKLKADGIEVIVIGHNPGQKQEINLGRYTNQSFVSIPFSKFIQIMQTLSFEYEIPVIVREESYTSKASCLDLDSIPTYGVDPDDSKDSPESNEPQQETDPETADMEKHKYTFSGKRTKRGLYRSKDGRTLNADINGAANILRKEYPNAFNGVDMDYLCVTTLKTSAYEILNIKKRENHKSNSKVQNRKSVAASVNHRIREGIQYRLDTAFGAKRKVWWKPPKDQKQIEAA